MNVKNLKKLRLTVDQLEMRIRNEGINKFDDIKFATIEPNGLLGFELAEDAKPLTIREFKTLMESYGFQLNNNISESTQSSASIFNEINGKQKPENPKLK